MDSQALDGLYRDFRRHAFGVAYRMLGSVSEAEDIVQDAFLRLSRAEAVESPKAYLTAVVTRLAIDHLRSARVRRESYVGHWLPEPLVEPEVHDDSLSIAFLLLLETLSPVERAVFVLHDVFEMEFSEIAGIVEKSAENCRQIATRARKSIEARRPRFVVSDEKRHDLANRFFAAVTGGDLAGLVQLLAAEVTYQGDGGGKARAFPRVIHGAQHTARLLIGLARKLGRWGVRIEPAVVNGQPGAIGRDADGRILNVMVLDLFDDGRVHAIHTILNPEKLGHLGPISDLARMT